MQIKPLISLMAMVLTLSALPGQADPLQRPARLSGLADKRLLTALAFAGPDRLVAVGQRGHVLISADGGANWQQMANPVSSDLSAVQFVDQRRGYAVGHDGVVLGTTDGGASWQKLLDGRSANTLALAQLKQTADSPERARLLDELQRNVDAGPDKPLLDLFFTSAQEGFVVGAYNLIFQTRDGGKTWRSWYDRSDNSDKLFNLYSIRAHKGQLFVAGEAGVLMRLDEAQQRFVRLDAGYTGSFFGLLDTGDALIAHGMRGNAVISRDGGNSWAALDSGLPASITASAKAADGSLWLADQLGNVRVSRDGGQRFVDLKQGRVMPVAAILVTSSDVVMAGPRGVRSVPLSKE